MNPLRLALAASLLAAAPASAQQGYDAKDAKKAAALAADDRDFARLSEDEQKKVIETIALQIHGRRRKARQALIVTRKGTSVEELEKQAKSMRSYKLVSATQDKEPVATAPEKTITTHEVQTPDFGRLFADNEWEISEGSPDAQKLAQQVDAVLMTVRKTGGRVVSVHVESSASTLANSGKAAKMTHLELSRKRAEAAADFVTKRLAANGVALDDDQVTLDYTGGNGNGTTGPSSPFPCKDPQLCAAGSCEAPPDVADAVKKGFDDKTRKLLADTYDPFKFVSVSFVVANETAAEKPGVSAPGEAHSVLVAVDYKEKPEFHWPRIRIRLPRLPKSHRNWGSTACPRFH